MHIERFIKEQALLPKEAKLLVGVSGGADSSVLLHLLWRLHYDVVVAHCNFHLRGEESDADALFVQNLAEQYAFDFQKIDFDTETIASQRGISIEMAARELRYEWFEQLRSKKECAYIVVGHHADDAVETFFLNLLRGSGLKGLSGMRAKRDNILRPLLGVTRADILDYIQEYNLSYRNDITNLETIYRRNKLRLDVIPQLQEINPSLTDTILSTAKRMDDANAIVQWASEKIFQEVCYQQGEALCYDLSILRSYPGHETLLFEWLHQYGFSQQQIEQMLRCDAESSGQRFDSRNNAIIHSRAVLFLQEKELSPNQALLNIPLIEGIYGSKPQIQLSFIKENNTFVIDKSPRKALLDASKLSFPLQLRKWRHGDYFYPFGMKGRKKISDFITDLKLSPIEKENIYVLISNQQVVWVVGYRIDNRFAIHKDTFNKIELSIV